MEKHIYISPPLRGEKPPGITITDIVLIASLLLEYSE